MTIETDVPVRGRVLVVDDEESIRTSLEVFLEDCGYIVSAAADAHEALALLARGTYDVLIIDLRLQNMSGEELIIEAHRKYPGLGFLVYTGISSYQPPPELERIGVGPGHVLVKPVQQLSLIEEAVEKVLESQKKGRSNA